MRAVAASLFLLLVGCSEPVVVAFHPADKVPERLSAWGLLLTEDSQDKSYLRLNDGVLPYELNTPLFSDYSTKLRTVWLPEGKSAQYDASDAFAFPVGTIISKTFYYRKASDFSTTDFRVVGGEREAVLDVSGRLDLNKNWLVETRLLVHYDDGWRAFPYVWNSDQSEAWLEIAGAVRRIGLEHDERERSFVYVVPDQNQCAGCHAPDHTGGEIKPIGLKARHLNRDNQIEHWDALGVLSEVGHDIPRAAAWLVPADASLDDRARAYLDINCAHCHNSAGAADTSGLHLDANAPVDQNFGICKSPTAVGQGSGDRLYDIFPGRPDESILLYRMQHSDPAIAMPELGRSTVHAEGVALIREWISSLEGDC